MPFSDGRARSGSPAPPPIGDSSARPIAHTATGSSPSLAAIPSVAAAHPEAAGRLVARHGTEAPGVVALGGELDLLRPLVPGRPFLEAEVAWAVRHELALSVDDVLSRRFRLSPELADRGAGVAPRVAEIMGNELGWDEARRALEADIDLMCSGL